MQTPLTERLIADISASGPLPFEQLVEQALYDADHGFYAAHGRAGGRRGDFVTSVEVGPLFAGVVADWLDDVWTALDYPRPFLVAEVGAGVGTLFRGINRAKPDCLDALTYTLVERSAAMRVAHQSLPTDRWASAADLPDPRQHVVLANELLDNLAFGIAERVADGWAPVEVRFDGLGLLLAPAAATETLDYLDALAPGTAVGTRVPTASAAADWVREAHARADRVVAFDYAATTAELAERGQTGWLRTYASHGRGDDPLADIGRRDITHDVPIDQLPVATKQSSQADWLRDHGIEQRVERAKQVWAERGHIGDLEAMMARSAIGEAEALTDPDGLGAFTVLEWHST